MIQNQSAVINRTETNAIIKTTITCAKSTGPIETTLKNAKKEAKKLKTKKLPNTKLASNKGLLFFISSTIRLAPNRIPKILIKKLFLV